MRVAISGRHNARRRRLEALVAAWQLKTLVGGLVVIVALAVALPEALGLPTFSPSALATPSVLIVSWCGALLAVHAGFEPAWDLYATEGARVQAVNLARIVSVAATSGVASWIVLDNLSMTFTATACLLGVALINASFVGHRVAWVAPTAYLIVIIGAGAVDPVGEPRLWAAPGNPAPGVAECVYSAAVLLVGMGAWWSSRARQPALANRD